MSHGTLVLPEIRCKDSMAATRTDSCGSFVAAPTSSVAVAAGRQKSQQNEHGGAAVESQPLARSVRWQDRDRWVVARDGSQ